MALLSSHLRDLESKHTVRKSLSKKRNLPVLLFTHIADKLNSNTNLWDQNLYVNDELVSNISTSAY